MNRKQELIDRRDKLRRELSRIENEIREIELQEIRYTLLRRKQLTARRFGRSLEISRASVERRQATNPGPGQPRKEKHG